MEAIVATLQKLVWLAEISEEMRAQYRAEHGAAPEPNAPASAPIAGQATPNITNADTPELNL